MRGVEDDGFKVSRFRLTFADGRVVLHPDSLADRGIDPSVGLELDLETLMSILDRHSGGRPISVQVEAQPGPAPAEESEPTGTVKARLTISTDAGDAETETGLEIEAELNIEIDGSTSSLHIC